MHGARPQHHTQDTGDNSEPTPHTGLLAWWQRRSWRVDLAVLARVRDGLNRLDEEPAISAQVDNPPANATLSERIAEAGASVPPSGVLPDPAIASIRETFAIVAAAGDEPASYFYSRLFVAHPHVRNMFPPAMDAQRDRLLGALVRIVEGLTSPEDLARYLSQLGRDHRKYSVEPQMYDAVGEALIATLRSYAGAAFTPAAEEAWVQAYQAASGLMIRAAEEDSAVAPAFWTAEVVSNELRQPGIAVVTVAPDQAFSYLPGQHVTVQTTRWPRVWRAYSVASRPREDGLMTFHVRAVPGGWVSNALVRYTAPGDSITLGPALGTMTLDRAGRRDLLCVAGGTGLAPIKAIIEQAIRESSACPRQIFLFYGARTRNELHDLPDLYRLTDAYPRFLLTPVTSDDPAFDGMQGNVGRVAARYLPHGECEAYVAGPVAMVSETIGVLVRAGIPQERIHYDDALLAAGQRVSPPPATAEAEPPDDDAPNDETSYETSTETSTETSEEPSHEASRDASGEQPEREQVSAGRFPAPT
jgi:NAD(P)H-flavin reductase/hemoglobin-like flavoprotein